MKKWRYGRGMMLLMAGALVLLFGAGFFMRVPEPKYEGVPLGALLDGRGNGDPWRAHRAYETLGANAVPHLISFLEMGVPLGALLDGRGSENSWHAHRAVEKLGAKAVPYLMNVLETEPTRGQKTHEWLYRRIPPRFRKGLPVPQDINLRRIRAAALLSAAESNAIPAIPLLVKVAEEDGDLMTRFYAIETLAKIAPASEHAERAIGAIAEATDHQIREMRQHAYRRLRHFTNNLEKIVPIFLEGLRGSEVKVKDICRVELNALGTNIMPVAHPTVKIEGYLPMSFEELEREVSPPAE
jgi:hypothetical protein